MLPNYLFYLIYKSHCVCAYISGIEIQTTRPITMKFGMGILLNGGKVCSWDLTPYPNPGALNGVWRASAASTVQLGENFIRQQL
jgi:hypothetical protein